MKRITRRSFLKGVGAAAATTAIVACGKDDSGTTSTAGTAGTSSAAGGTADAVLDDISEKKTINFTVCQHPLVADLNTNAFTLWLEEVTNTDIVINPIMQSEFDDKLDIMMATGDYPEVCGCMEYHKIDFYGPLEGAIIPLDDYINEELTPRLLEVDAENPGYLDSMRQLDGKIYSIGKFEETVHTLCRAKLWYYSPMLEETGLPTPTTTDEFYDVLKAIKSNGHIPLMTYNDLSGRNDPAFSFVVNAFLFFTSAEFAMWNDGGTVKSAVTEDAYREALKFMRKLYAEGLYYNNSISQTENQLKSIADNIADPQVCFVGALMPQTAYTLPANPADNPLYANQLALTPLKGPAGVQYAQTEFPATPSTKEGSFFITTALDPDLIPRAMRIVNTMCEEEAWRRTYGVEGEHWEFSEDGKLGMDGVTPAVFNSFTGWNAKLWGEENVSWVNYFPTVQTHETRMSVEAPEGLDIYSAVGSEALLYKVMTEQYMDYIDREMVLPTIRYTAEEIDETSRQRTDVLKKIEDSRVAFMTGALDVESDDDWNTYLSDLEKMGLSEIIAQIQMGYDRQFGNA